MLFFFLFLIGLFSSVSKFYIIAFFLSFMVFAKVFILPIELVLFVSFATLLVFNPIFVGFLEIVFERIWQSHTLQNRLDSYETFFNSISDWQQLFVGFPCNNCGGYYSDSSFINVLSGNGMFLGTIIIVAPIVSLIFWLGRLNDQPIGKKVALLTVFLVVYSSILVHYQLEVQPTQILFYLASFAPFLRSKGLNSTHY